MALTAQLLLQTCCPSAKRAAPTAAEVVMLPHLLAFIGQFGVSQALAVHPLKSLHSPWKDQDALRKETTVAELLSGSTGF